MLNYCLSQALISVMLATWGFPPYMSPYFDTLDLGLCLTRVESNYGKVLVLRTKGNLNVASSLTDGQLKRAQLQE